MTVTRRHFLKSVAAGTGAVSVPAVLTGCFSDDDDADNTVFAFGHGVASGDPLSDAVIIWTRVTPDTAEAADVAVAWAVASDENMTDVVAQGTQTTGREQDFTVKVDVTGLSADTSYYYQFAVTENTASVVGRTRTLPAAGAEVSSVKLAVCSCSNYPAGLFNAYKEMANSEADVVVHLGDYIYEYGSNEYPTADAQVRAPEPAQEILTLDNYRARYAQYRSDSYLQLAHQNKPFICVWDDHEIANDTYKDGAENHDEDSEGSFTARRAAAVQAYHEWLPIRTGSDPLTIYRTFDFGNLLSLHMLDTRVVARDKQLSYSTYLTASGIDATAFAADLADSSRTLMGSEQLQTVQSWMASSSATWQVIGQQVLMGRMNVPQELLLGLAEVEATLAAGGDATSAQAAMVATMTELVTIKSRILAGDTTVTAAEQARVETVAPYNLDAWDGYLYNREQLLATAVQLNKNMVVLAGDTHNAWASDIYPLDSSTYSIDRSSDPAAVEFATGSVTSPGFERYMGFGSDESAQAQFEYAVTTLIDDLQYLNAAQRGYMLVELTAEAATASWHYVSTITGSGYTTTTAGPLQVLPGAGNRRLAEEF